MNLLKMSASATILILAIVIVRSLLLHRLPKRTFLILWGVALCRLLIPFSIPSRLSIFTFANILKNRFDEVASPSTVMQTPINDVAITETLPVLPKTQPVNISTVLVIWIIGLTACALFFLVIHLRCRREYKTALPVDNEFMKRWKQEHLIRRHIQVQQSDKIAAPLTYGIFCPVLLLPKETVGMDEVQLQYILEHEFVHIRRFDTLTKLLLATAFCVHWFNPFVWIMYVLANRDIELSCDESVVRTFGEPIKSAYALTLIELEEKKSGLTPLINNFSKNSIEERIVSIMKMKTSSSIGILIALAVVIGTITVFATNGTAAGSKGTQINNAEKNDASVGTNETAIAYTNSLEENDIQVVANPTQQELLEEYGPYGISIDEDGNVYFNNELVRYFYDGVDLGDTTSIVRYEYIHKDGTVDVHTTWKATDNGNGSIDPLGELTGVKKYSKEEFEQRNIDDLMGPSKAVTNISESTSAGETFAQMFSKYESYGITYKEQENSGIGNIYYNDKLVSQFVDENNDGKVFSFQSVDSGGIIVHTVYNENNKLIGVEQQEQ